MTACGAGLTTASGTLAIAGCAGAATGLATTASDFDGNAPPQAGAADAGVQLASRTQSPEALRTTLPSALTQLCDSAANNVYGATADAIARSLITFDFID